MWRELTLTLCVLLLAGPGISRADEVPGDWNRDGRLTSVDALAAMRMASGAMPADLRMDVDGDGATDGTFKVLNTAVLTADDFVL